MRLAAALLVLATLLAGCARAPDRLAAGATTEQRASSPATTEAGPAVITMSELPTDPYGNPPSSSTAAAVPTASASVSQDVSAFAPCAVPYVRVSARPAGARNAHAAYLIEFADTGQIACRLAGYPAVTVLDAHRRPLARAAAAPRGYLGGLRSGAPQPVLIGPGQRASALVEGEQIDLAGKPCPAGTALRVTPPATRTAAVAVVRTTICGGVQVHPVVAGTTGSSG
ncbi:MAG TPA: DUF4232 domain-containing protein [Jatrophihabitans sp.]|nr:DUF4232 domain-containing protein [Jatrophihabitans sp.]